MKWKNFILQDNSINIINPEKIDDYDLFFGPLTDEEKTKYKTFKAESISDILLELGLAESRSWCKKNGWGYKLENGWTDIKFGSLKIRLCILN